MQCNVCGRINGHLPGCPEYNGKPPRGMLKCCVCEEGIFEGDKYITNDNGESRHFDCYDNMHELLSWLGYQVKVMEDIRDEYF